ncbi:hypothetical protein MPSEU_000421900 [Mayamaea pseudoterrestris]|nr:hypothetical protein MPSEU_000421900 [Mayamaea pseudoterrestris]
MSLKYTNNSNSSSNNNNRNITNSNSHHSLKCTDLAQFDALLRAADSFRTDDKLHLRNLLQDSARCASLIASKHGVYHIRHDSIENNVIENDTDTLAEQDIDSQSHHHDNTYLPRHSNHHSAAAHSATSRTILLDYSRQCLTGETMELLFDLADAMRLTDRREALKWGLCINETENRPVLHHLFRLPHDYSMENDHHYYHFHQDCSSKNDDVDLAQVTQSVRAVRQQVKQFCRSVRSGVYKSITNKPFCNIIVIGIGNHTLGPDMVSSVLEHDEHASRASFGRRLRFLSNLDPTDLHACTHDLNPAETLVIVSCKHFVEAECMVNVRAMRSWLVRHLGGNEHDEKQIVARHMVAISSNVTRCVQFGIAKHHVFQLPEWIVGRFSLCSAVGLLPLSLHYSSNIMEQFLDGCHDMDEHYFHAPLRDNLPILLALLGIWNSTFLGHSCSAILPYSDSLRQFPAHVQQVDMESNGKRVALDGTPLLHRSAVVTFGDVGSNCQNTFFQLLHQGRVVPSDFIGFMQSQQQSLDAVNEPVSNHDELMSYFFSQPDALAYGKTLVDLVQEGAPEPLREHMVFPGNRPSSCVLMTKLDAFALGQLVTLYEHRTVTQGFIWGINSFDQFGLDLGRTLAKSVRAQLGASRRTGASVQGFNYSTSFLLEHYLANGKTEQQHSNNDQTY